MTGNSSKDVRADLQQWIKAIIHHWVAIAATYVTAFP